MTTAYQRAMHKLSGVQKPALREAFHKNYSSLLGQRTHDITRILNWHLVRNILPGIALYQALEQEGRSKIEAILEMEQLYLVLYRNTARIYRVIGHVPGFFSLLRHLCSWSMKVTYPADGWGTIWIDNNPDWIAFDIYSCFYQEVLKEYGYEHILQCFCKIDDDMYRAMSPIVEWARTTTLGRGGTVCNFRYIKKRKTMESGDND